MDKIPASSIPKYTIPEPRAATVRRQRLLDFLHGNIEQPLQLICAPAGYGKTTLLADFAKDTDLTVCWYSIDELDRDPRSFLTHLSEAIETRIAAFGDPNELMIDQVSGINMDWQSMVPGIVEGIRKRIREFFVLIVDDFHILTGSEAVTESLDLLIQQLPDNCRIIISTREIPHLASLPRLISQRMVSGLGPTELKFNIDEIKDLLKKNFDLEVSTEEAERLEQESEGWITSILLTTHSLWKGLFKEVLVNQGQNSLLFEYMASEVFSQQPPQIQKYLLNTSICNEFDAELGDALTDGLGQNQILQEIEYRNLFVTRLKGPNPWYRYHHLFRDYLRDKLKREDPEGFLRLYAKAGDHFLSKGDPRQAIHFYLLGSEFEKALGLLEEQAESLSQQGLWDTLGNWLEQIPTELRATRPKLLLHLSTVYVRKGKNDEAIRLLNDIIEVFRKEEEHILEAQALTRRSVALRYKGAHQMAVRDARQALSLAQDHGIPIDEADARSSLGTAYARQGKFPRAEREFKLALESYQEHGSLFQLTDIHSRIALVYVYIGDSAKAITHFEQARQGWQTLNNQSSLGLTLSNMAYFYCEQGRYEDAEPLALEAISLAQTAHSIRNEAQALDELTEILREQGRYEEALKSHERALELARQCMETPLVSRLCIGFGETYRRTGDNHKAKSLIKEGMALASDLGQDFELGTGCTSLGIIEYTSQNSEEGIALLQRACQLFDRSKQKRNLSRAKFHLAHALFQIKRYTEATEHLNSVAQLCEELGYDQFLLTDAASAQLMVQYGSVARGPSREFYARIREQIERRTRLDSASTPKEKVAPQTTSAVPRIEARGFGQPRVFVDGNLILSTAWGSVKAREMFIFMLFNGQPMHKEKIIEAIWPETYSSKANSNFHSTLHRMKMALYPNCVERDGELYQLNPQWHYWLDAREFETLVQQAEKLNQNEVDRERWSRLSEQGDKWNRAAVR